MYNFMMVKQDRDGLWGIPSSVEFQSLDQIVKYEIHNDGIIAKGNTLFVPANLDDAVRYAAEFEKLRFEQQPWDDDVEAIKYGDSAPRMDGKMGSVDGGISESIGTPKIDKSLIKRQAISDGSSGRAVRYHFGDLPEKVLDFYLKYWHRSRSQALQRSQHGERYQMVGEEDQSIEEIHEYEYGLTPDDENLAGSVELELEEATGFDNLDPSIFSPEMRQEFEQQKREFGKTMHTINAIFTTDESGDLDDMNLRSFDHEPYGKIVRRMGMEKYRQLESAIWDVVHKYEEEIIQAVREKNRG